jgi:two-component system, cell cycle sensor histidine kinase and response regulator CckA
VGQYPTNDPYRLLFEHAGEMACTLDLGGSFTAVNPAGVHLTGYSEQELIGTLAIDLIAEEARAEAVRQFERRLRVGGVSTADESILVTRDGNRVPIEITSTIFTDDAGAPVGVLGLVRDMSERRAAASALLLSEERFRSAFDQAAIGMALVGLDGRWLQVNESLCRLLGFTRDELLRKTFQDVTHPDDLVADLAFVRRLLAGEIPGYQMEKRYFHKEGGVVWVLLNVSVVRAEDGSPSYFISQIQDITEQRSAQLAVERSTVQLAEAQQLAQIGSWERDARGAISWSDEMYRIYGFDRSTDVLTEARIVQCIHPDDRAVVLETARVATQSHQPFLLDYRLELPDGEIRWIHGRGETVFDGDNAIGRRGTVQDITERKQAETDRDRLRDELHHAHKLEAIGRIAAGVAHDFNNMLTAIEGYSELLLARLEPHTAEHAHAAQIKRAAEQAATLPRQLLAFGRKQTLAPDVVDLRDVVRNIDELLRSIVSARIRLETVVTGPALAYVDADKLEQALINLVVNARDAMPEGGQVSITIATEDVDHELAAEHDVSVGRYSVVRVEDTGHGIGADTITNIFEPFFTTKPSGLGSGLGLASVYGTVNQSGGFVRVESEPGKGARFEIFLPTPQQLAIPSSERTVGVLLAEDEPLVRDLAVSVLEGGGFEVRAAANGEDALALFDRHADAIDVVVTDMVMPELGGLGLAERVRERRPETPIVYMSGYTDEGPPTDPNGSSVPTFLEKPFSAETLVSAVRAATHPQLTPLSTAVSDSEVVAASLTPREREVLALVAHGGTNEKVAQTLGISTETVQSHVRNAMAKLDADTRTEAVAIAIRHSLID